MTTSKSMLTSATLQGLTALGALSATQDVSGAFTRLIATAIAVAASSGTSIDRPPVTTDTLQDAAIVAAWFGSFIYAAVGRWRVKKTLTVRR